MGRLTLRLMVVCAAVVACTDTAEVTPLAAITDAPGALEDGLSCDAGTEAWVRRVMPHLWGRRPHSVDELAVMAAAADTYGREALAHAMMRAPAFQQRLLDITKDWLRVNRTGERVNDCSSFPEGEAEGPELAEWVRDHAPDGGSFREPWNATDLITSAIALDDMSPVFRAGLFMTLGSRPFEIDVDETELAWRQIYSDMFERVYLNRRMQCLSCHNSAFSVTGSPDPELDRTWEVPGKFEKAIFGDSAGRPTADLVSFFRVRDVLSLEFNPGGPLYWVRADGVHPWGMKKGCGAFIARDEVAEDDLGADGFFIEAVGTRSSIWDLESMLSDGIASLRNQGLTLTDDGDVDGRPALAWLTSMSYVEHLYSELTGRKLTIAHGFPRNRYQRDWLKDLTDRFVDNDFSAKSVIAAVVTHPYFNQGAAAHCEGLPGDFYMAPVFDPWSVEQEDPQLRNNSVGDAITRLPPRVLLESAITALGWTFSVEQRLGDAVEEEEPRRGRGEDPTIAQAIVEIALSLDIGMFEMDAEPGFRESNLAEQLAWEEAVGSCLDPLRDKEAPRDADFVDRIIEAAQGHTAEAAVVAMKDRLLADPIITADERPLLEALLGASLSAPIEGIAATEPLRRVCAALLMSPQFVMEGLPVASRLGQPRGLVPAGEERLAFCQRAATAMGASCDGSALRLN